MRILSHKTKGCLILGAILLLIYYMMQSQTSTYIHIFKPRMTAHKYSINPTEICNGEAPLLLALILSVPSHADYRMAIRETWTRTEEWPDFQFPGTFKSVFLFGKHPNPCHNFIVIEESKMYGDIIVGDFVDSYDNLTLKVLIGLEWVRHFCPNAKYVMKVDEDSFVHMPNLYKTIIFWPSFDRTIFGFYVPKPKVARKGKYAVSIKEYSPTIYPPYTTGNLYLATSKTFFSLLNVAQNVSRHRMEDVFITGILAKIANVKHRPFLREQYNEKNKLTPCQFINGNGLLSKDYNSKDMRNVWRMIQDNTTKCK